MQKAFTMIELVFAIVVIGILAVVAVPKLAPIIGSAQEAKAKATLASVRSALSTERQKLILRGNFTAIGDLGDGSHAFSDFDGKQFTTSFRISYRKLYKQQYQWMLETGRCYTLQLSVHFFNRCCQI